MADGANITLATAQGAAPTPRRDVGRDEHLAGEPLGPSVSRGLQPGWKNSPLTKAQHKGPASVGFSLHCCCLQARINFLLGSMKGRAQVSLPWKLLAHENLNLTNC